MIYGVFYYNLELYSKQTVKNAGLFSNKCDAFNRLHELIPNREKHIKNTIKGNNRVAWINQYELNKPIDVISNYPHNTINCFSQD